MTRSFERKFVPREPYTMEEQEARNKAFWDPAFQAKIEASKSKFLAEGLDLYEATIRAYDENGVPDNGMPGIIVRLGGER